MSATPYPQSSTTADDLVEPAIELVHTWLTRSRELESREDRAANARLRDLVTDDDGVAFVMAFVDRVARPDSQAVAADQLASLVASSKLPSFLSPIDRALLKSGGLLATRLPGVVIPLARRRMRQIVGHLVAPAEPEALAEHLSDQRSDGYALNVNLLGEAVLGRREAKARMGRLIELLHQPDIDYVSIKLSALAPRLNHWDHETSLTRVTEGAAAIIDASASLTKPTFVNFDMEEYHDLDLTVAAFKAVMGEETRRHLDAGIVLQAYLPDVFEIMKDLVAWSNDRHAIGGGVVKIRLVKGANLAMERVDAALHGWEQAPYGSKVESDANYRRCLDWVLDEHHLAGVRIGLASHNLFDVAWTKLVAEQRGVLDRVQFEMLQGMAVGQAKAVNETTSAATSSNMLLYTPAVADADFDVAIGYLFRRLEENASEENFMRALFDLTPESAEFQTQAGLFRQGVTLRTTVASGPRRTQDRAAPTEPSDPNLPFRNEPDTDPSLTTNQSWIKAVATASATTCQTPLTTDMAELDRSMNAARTAQGEWAALPSAARELLLHRVGDELASRRGEFITTMMHEASKTFSEADGEVSEAIDFARWYAERSRDLDQIAGATFTPFGVVAVVPPWNFPTAIPCGGVLSALAAGNVAILKPAPETPRCAELIAEACWSAGIPRDIVQFIRTPDDEVGRHLIESVDAVILTGASETAELFASWKPGLRLFAETSGKNVLIITPNADLDLAVDDLVRSAFGHAGQKCSAASLAILVGDVATSDRFRRQLADAVETLQVGPALDLSTDVPPLVGGINDRLAKAASELGPGEQWLVKPTIDGTVMTPGVRDGVRPGSWFHRTECFGPVLGLMHAADLDEAIAIANSSDFGLTGGIHTLDPTEITQWMDSIEIGNGYVNRAITGAIVQRQPFGGWKRSSVGPGAKAGGPNYVMQLGTWAAADTDRVDQIGVEHDYAEQWRAHFSVDHDNTGLECEANVFRYRPLAKIGLLLDRDASEREVMLVRTAANIAGVEIVQPHLTDEAADDVFVEHMVNSGVDRVRVVGHPVTDELARQAREAGVELRTAAVTPAGRIELQHYVREQAMSVTLHRFGNLVAQIGPPRETTCNSLPLR